MERNLDHTYQTSKQHYIFPKQQLNQLKCYADKNNDLPRQMTSTYYQNNQQKKQNRPLVRKLFHQNVKDIIKIKKQTAKLTTQSDLQTLRKQPSPIYRQIIQLSKQSNQKQTQSIGKIQILAQATFKPNNYPSNEIHSKIQSNIRKLFKQKLKITQKEEKSQKKEKLTPFKLKQPQTRYQKILNQFFKKNSHQKDIKPKPVLYKTFENKPFIYIQKKQQSTDRLKKEKPLIIQTKSMKRSQSQGWMSMNFYERQEHILKTRKDKQNFGKKQNYTKQIQKCTFKPSINKYSIGVSQQSKSTYFGAYTKKMNQKNIF